MPEMSALTHHDLPPKWDGWPVEWEEWGWFVGFICFQSKGSAPRQDVCGKCGHVGEQPMARGVATDPGPLRTNFRKKILLIAFRCQHCRHDVVASGSGEDRWWDLEPADYLDAGSVA